MIDAAAFTLPTTAAEFFKVIHESFTTRLEALPTCVTTFYDTFDWRIHRAGAVLQCSKGSDSRLLAWSAEKGQVRSRLEGLDMPQFVWDLDPGPLRDLLDSVIKMRRLLPVVHVETKGLILHILGAEEKTVARIRLLDSTVRVPGEKGCSDLPSMLEIVSIKGYEKSSERLTTFAENQLGLIRTSSNTFQRAVQAASIVPGDYTSKFRVKLDPEMTMFEAAVSIHQGLLNSILVNEEGTRQDLDSEFLHDFRVAVRRTRSALSQIRKVFPEAHVKRFGKEFAWLGKITGPSRDLDVYLLKMENYKALLPESIREDLKPLHEFLKNRQKEEHRHLVAALNSKRYKCLLHEWRQFLDHPIESEVTSKAAAPVQKASTKRIWKIYRRILKKGGEIDDQSPAVFLHRLRIECKKLRYLLEFFRSLHEPREIRQLIRSLRNLQDNLGDFNDYEVQQATLKGFAQNMQDEGKGHVETLMAMGRLIERFEVGQQKARERFSKRFSKFSSASNEKRFRALFSPDKVMKKR